MKKFLIILVGIFSIISIFGFNSTYAAEGEELGPCNYDIDNIDSELDISGALSNCLEGTNLVNANANIKSGSFGTSITNWVNNIAIYLGIFAVGAIVFGGMMMTLSTGEDEKVKKAKDIVKWGIIGFLGLIFASAIINLVVKIMYSL